MGRLDRYIVMTAGVAFVAALSTLTGMVWLTQILRRFDLMTSQGQTILVFFTVTGLALPTLILLTAPMALFLAITYTLNKLNGDSELIVMSAAGLSQWQLFRPLFVFSFVVTIISAYLSIEGGPDSVRMLRDQIAVVNADIISNVALPGRFAALDRLPDLDKLHGGFRFGRNRDLEISTHSHHSFPARCQPGSRSRASPRL